MNLDEILNSHQTRQPVIVGVLNITPDSFSDGGQFMDPRAAVLRAREMVEEGAAVIDIGAESTRPGSARVGADEQISRLSQVLPAVVALGAVVSVDTTLAEVARFALKAGAKMINDVAAGRDDAGLLAEAGRAGAAVVLMHMLGQPKTMQEDPQYGDVVAEVKAFLAARVEAAVAAGVGRDRLIVDPGIGFGKRLEHNLALLAGVGQLCQLGRPVMVGISRKRFLGELTGQTAPAQRVAGTVAACLAAWQRGATIFRVHDVRPLADALAVYRAIEAN